MNIKHSFFSIILTMILSVHCLAITPIDSRPIVQIETSMGIVIIRLFPDEAPITCENFLSYVNEGFYDNTIFHRVIDGFIVQGGGFTTDLKPKNSKEPIKNESQQGLSNIKGTVAMALTIDNNSASSQFFFNMANNTDLNYTTKKGKGYTVFAEIIDGFDIVEKIQKIRTTRIMFYSDIYKRNIPLHDVPEDTILLKTATVLRN